ncbi:hypothetical protein CMI45_00650 [Candidatus Pacearchaeota archaeon]|nr:hypothetical protein [Candidatus Pacearchaeota archaeon]|tara:strand:+ start:224 stop:1081 length:858 start_codon:yes stop_codon:yes gene_type:complete
MVKLSIIIPTHNEESDISSCLQSLEKQSFSDFEVIVVDDGSTDDTLKIVKNHKGKLKIKIIKGQHKGPGFSRNLGAKSAKGEILIFIDADMTFHKDYLKNLTSPIIKNKKIIGTCHDYELVENISNIWSRCWGRVRVSKKEAKNITIFRAIRRSVFLKHGGFDSKYGYADDQTLFFKYKLKPVVAPNSTCYHKNPETLRKVFNQSRWISASFDHKILNLPLLKYLIPLILVLISPIAIPILSVKKAIKNHDLAIIFPWMLIFMTLRYFGSISGISRKIYLNLNYR